ncbi:hypothetical protein V6N13_094251 [Hibiscus sabdariffa]|uniref:Secreted protein n=1 Tax=Hibiscus sabdariffa TaxID=183260 RepID=A0ABR2PQA8_9ROSI
MRQHMPFVSLAHVSILFTMLSQNPSILPARVMINDGSCPPSPCGKSTGIDGAWLNFFTRWIVLTFDRCHLLANGNDHMLLIPTVYGLTFSLHFSLGKPSKQHMAT